MAGEEAGKMWAVVVHGPKDYRYEQVPIPRIGAGEVLVRVLAVGICAGDAKCYAGAPHFWQAGEYGETYCQPPIIAGHEFVGEVVKIDEDAAKKFNLAIGDHAIAEQIVPCWECRYCLSGSYNMCLPHNIFGFRQKTPGAMATYMKYPRGAIIHKISKNVPADQAVFVEPLACAVHAVERADIRFQHVVVIAGAGAIGCAAISAARLKNPRLLIAVDLIDHKLEVAKKCGADVVLNPKLCNTIAEVKKLSEGYGCDVYIDATGHPSSVEQGLLMLCRQGTFVEYSVFGSKVTADWTIISDAKELTIKGGHLGPYCYPMAIRMIENGQIPVKDIITHRLPIDKFEEGIRMVNDSQSSIKVILTPPV